MENTPTGEGINMKVDVGIDYITCHNCRCLVALVTWVTSCQNCGQVVVSRTASHG